MTKRKNRSRKASRVVTGSNSAPLLKPKMLSQDFLKQRKINFVKAQSITDGLNPAGINLLTTLALFKGVTPKVMGKSPLTDDELTRLLYYHKVLVEKSNPLKGLEDFYSHYRKHGNIFPNGTLKDMERLDEQLQLPHYYNYVISVRRALGLFTSPFDI